ncbi:UNVERIFIED_CONTAM: hypothetical protein Slati_0926900 [Sesamum latifolium]|uniref:DUF4218 domain-containing protein n=1 Tax=Sesamum latifolium TaxID=2727402 RepID=A0AAW2XP04_9LAMI
MAKRVRRSILRLRLSLQCICSTTLDVHKLHELENSVAIILCNLEKIFPPAFFDSIEHFIVHLSYEGRVGGPVQYRWMYPFERFLRELKKKVKNKAHVEASIVEAYIIEEIGLFTSQYFEPGVQSKQTKPHKNDEHTNNNHGIQVSIFNYLGRASGAPKKRWLTGPEWHIIKTYILTNCEVVKLYIRVHPMLNSTKNKLLKSHYWGPSAEVMSVPCYFVNGYNFQTERHNTGKSTMNCGVCVKSSSYTDEDNDFYGIIEEIIQLTYPLILDLHIILFKCRWVDPVRGMKVNPRYHLVDVNFKKLYQKDESFILAQQVVQVYFTQYLSLKRDKADWFAVAKVKARRVVDESKCTEICAYQPDEVLPETRIKIFLACSNPER